MTDHPLITSPWGQRACEEDRVEFLGSPSMAQLFFFLNQTLIVIEELCNPTGQHLKVGRGMLWPDKGNINR